MEGSKSPETLQKHGNIVINTQQNVVFHGNRPLQAGIPTQKLIWCAFERPWGGLPNATGARGWGSTPHKIDTQLARNTKLLICGEYLIRITLFLL